MKHQALIAAGTVVIAGLASFGAQAQARTPLYAGSSLGRAEIDLACSSNTYCDQHATAFKLLLGYRLLPSLAVEASYHDQSEVNVTGARLAGALGSRGVGAHLVLIAPIADRGSLIGKIGVVAARIHLDQESERHVNVGWGVGGGYEFTTSLGSRLEFERIRGKFRDERVDIDMVTVSVLYRF